VLEKLKYYSLFPYVLVGVCLISMILIVETCVSSGLSTKSAFVSNLEIFLD
jgi:hypothetical protein